MLTRLIPIFFAMVAMAPLVVMVTGQEPTRQELEQAVTQATAEMEAEAAVHVSGGAEPDGAQNALARVHRSTPMARELSRSATVLEKVAQHFMGSYSRRTSSYTIAMLSAIDSRTVTSLCDATSMNPITCPTPAVPEFRSANGRCNNRNHPLWGSSEEPLRRLLKPVYDDGLMTPRTTGHGGAPLPSARLVSTTMHEDQRKSSQVNTHMVMQFGQFLDHDITLTPSFQEEGIDCTCGSEDEHCFNINIPSDDPDFAERPCLEFARSRSCPNEGCRMGRRQQLNQLTAFVDASNVYGSSDEEIEVLRGQGGADCSLKTTDATYRYRWDLPQLTGSRFTFQVSANNDAHIGLSPVNHDVTDMYEIVIGGWGNENSDIRRTKQGTNLAVTSTRAINSPTEYRTFWINWASDGTISVGKGGVAQPFMSWRDPNPIRVSYAGYSTGWGSTGRWVFCSNKADPQDCLTDSEGTSYRGTRQHTQSGLTCQRWDTSFPHEHEYLEKYPNSGLDGNYCRNPGGRSDAERPWCYTTDPGKRWEYCDIPECGVNLASGRPTAQSSTYTYREGAAGRAVAGRAVDGNTNGVLHHDSCTHTKHDSNPWWHVDLGTSQAIGNVVVFNRKDCCQERLNNFRVHVGDNPTVASNPQCGGNHAVTAGQQKITVDCGGLSGRYVGISLPTTEHLTLCEVQVYKASLLGARGLLKSRPNPVDANKKELLPAAMEEGFECAEFTGSETCSQAGDVRVNEQPGLTSMHTVFLREHNRIARRLSQLNPSWDDDRVFFETRKIVGALMQKITYGEDLPHVLGPAYMTKFRLTLLHSGFFSGYDPSVNPTISNVFATAAYRFGHSLVQNLLLRYAPDFNEASTCPIRLAFGFFNPSHILNNDQGGPDSILRGMTTQAHQYFDRSMVSGLTKHLFAVPPGSHRGLDLAALNIQRGRDHGLPGYNAWRVECGLPRARRFADLEKEIPDVTTRQKLESVYSHVDDIDLFVGGLAEESVSGGIVGPTFACLIGLQFQDLRKGDRFWFENRGQFSWAQLAEIRKTSLARILCDNTDGTTHMQPDVFSLPTQPGNERVACSSLPQMDLTKWRQH